MNELSDLLLALIDLRINTQLNNSNFLRKYNGYVVDVNRENIKVMMDFTQMDTDESQAYTFINKTGSTNIQKGDNVEILCNKDFSNGYVSKNFSVKQICVTSTVDSKEDKFDEGITIRFSDSTSTKLFTYDYIQDNIKVFIKNGTCTPSGTITAFIEFRGGRLEDDTKAIITKLFW